MRAPHLLVVAAALCGACKKDKSKDQPPSPTAPASTAAQDALWALAPEGAMVGIVVAPSALAKLEAGARAVEQLFAAAPDLAPFKARMDAELEEALGTKSPNLADAGLTSTKGFAVFVVEGKAPIAILPIGDRDKFLAVVKGQKGADSDTIKRATCKTVKDVYACARDPEMFDLLGKGKLDGLQLAGARGDVELVAVVPEPALTIAAVAQLGRGSVVVRGAVRGVPPQVKPFLANAKPRVDGDRTAGFALVNVGPYLEVLKTKVPPVEIADGVRLDELVKTVVGPLTVTVGNAAPTFDLRLPLTDGGAAQKLLAQCDKLPPLAEIGATVKDGVCNAKIPQMELDVDAWVDGTTLRLGKKGSQSTGPSAPLSPVAQELASGEWMLAMFGRGTIFGPMALPMPMPMSAMPPEAMLGMRVFAMINELGIGVRVDGDVVRVLATARTAWANPDDVVNKIIAIGPEAIAQGESGAAAKAIADASPKSPFAADHATGYAGLMVPAMVVGMMSAVAIPAFAGYMKKSKQSEAALQLRKLEKNLKVAGMTDGALPRGNVGPTPAKSCCETGGKCMPDPAAWSDPVWQALEFQLDEPHLYRYSYASTDGKTFVAKAHADLDCDGQEIEYVLTGAVGPDGTVTVTHFEPPASSD